MPFGNLQPQFDEILQQGIRALGLTVGVMASVELGGYRLEAVQSNSGAFVPGEVYPLGNSYCREVISQQSLIAVIRTGEAPLELHHPLYSSLPLECFIGAPIYMHGEVWGLIDFSSMTQRDEAFSKQDEKLVLALADEVSALVDSSGFKIPDDESD